MPKRKPVKQQDAASIAAEIASGQLKVRIHNKPVETPITLDDVVAGEAKPFQPSAWRAPAWRKTTTGHRDKQSGQCGYVCDDPWQQVYAMQVIELNGFNLPEFDLWLSKMPPCGLRDELARLRHGLMDDLAANDKKAARARVARLERERAYGETVSSLPPELRAEVARLNHLVPMIVMQCFDAVAAARQKRAGSKNTGKRAVRFADERDAWLSACVGLFRRSSTLSQFKRGDVTEFASEIKRVTGTKANKTTLRAWVKINEQSIRDETNKAIKAAVHADIGGLTG